MLQKKLDLIGILSNIQEREVFFIDEIHRLHAGRGGDDLLGARRFPHGHPDRHRARARARTRMAIPKFTAIGATTRQGLISAPLRGRFGLVLRLNHYDDGGAAADRAALGARC